MEKNIRQVAGTLLDAIDECSDGVALDEVWKIYMQHINFATYWHAVNRLRYMELITIDNNHVAHRVKT